MNRRTEMLRQHLKGIPLKLILEDLSQKYNAKETKLRRDWDRRQKWIPQIIQLDDPTLLHRCLEGAREIIFDAWRLAKNSDNEFVQLGALKLIKDTNLALLERLESAGVIQRAPVQVEQRILMIKGQWWRPVGSPESAQIQATQETAGVS